MELLAETGVPLPIHRRDVACFFVQKDLVIADFKLILFSIHSVLALILYTYP